jgi:hypothetical protein
MAAAADDAGLGRSMLLGGAAPIAMVRNAVHLVAPGTPGRGKTGSRGVSPAAGSRGP